MDITLSTDKISRKLTDWRLLQFATKSDHAIILVDLKLHRPELKKFQSTKSYILSKAKWEELTEEVSKKLDMESSLDVHQAVEHFTETLTSAMNSHVPQTRKRAPGQPKWWNEDLHKMRCEVQRLRRRTWKAKADHSYARWRNMYRTASRKYASAVRIAKAKSWKGFIEFHTALNAWGMPYNRGVRLAGLRPADGQKLTTPMPDGKTCTKPHPGNMPLPCG